MATCNKCGWVYFGVTLSYAVNEVIAFNNYFLTLTPKKQRDYYGGKGASLDSYLKCGCGNSYKNFRETKVGDCPDGCTINPILNSTEEDPYE